MILDLSISDSGDGGNVATPLTLGYLAELLLATEELWQQLPDPYPLMGRTFLDAILEGAGDVAQD